MEGLNNMIKVARENKWLRGFEVTITQTSISNGNMEVTHLQYTDDTLIFCDAKKGQLLVLRSILVLFEGVSAGKRVKCVLLIMSVLWKNCIGFWEGK